MSFQYYDNVWSWGEYNTYNIGGNTCKTFAIGTPGAEEDFFLVGSEPPADSSYPMLTGNVLSSDGEPLFRLVQNQLIINPGHCSKTIGNHVGYEIHDVNDQLIFRVETRYVANAHATVGGNWITTLHGSFYNRNKELVFSAKPKEEGGGIEASATFLCGADKGGIAFSNMNPDANALAAAMIATRGKIHGILRGVIEGQEVVLDGKALIDCHFRDCTLIVREGSFVCRGRIDIDAGCTLRFANNAENVHTLALGLIPPHLHQWLPTEFRNARFMELPTRI